MKRLLLILRHPVWWWQAWRWKRRSHTNVELIRSLASRNPFMRDEARDAWTAYITPHILRVVEDHIAAQHITLQYDNGLSIPLIEIAEIKPQTGHICHCEHPRQ